MSLLPLNSDLGHLELVEIFEYYDFPRLFSCRNATGALFIAVSIEDTLDGRRWLYVPVSPERLASIKVGAIDLREAFSSPEDGHAFIVSISHSGSCELERVEAKLIPDQYLPESGERLEIETATAFSYGELSPALIAPREKRDVVNVVVKPSGALRTEAPARKLGNLLTAIQELLDALGQKVNGSPTLRGAIPQFILDKTEVALAQLFPGSVGMQFKARSNSDLLNQSLFGESVSEWMNLISAADKRDLLSNKLHFLQGRAANKYRGFLEALDDLDTDLTIDWGSPDSVSSKILQMTRREISSALSIVSEITTEMADVIEIDCVLVGLNTRTMTYEVRSLVGNEKYSGRVAEEARSSVEHATLNETYKAQLRQLIEVQATSGEEKTRWILTRLIRD